MENSYGTQKWRFFVYTPILFGYNVMDPFSMVFFPRTTRVFTYTSKRAVREIKSTSRAFALHYADSRTISKSSGANGARRKVGRPDRVFVCRTLRRASCSQDDRASSFALPRRRRILSSHGTSCSKCPSMVSRAFNKIWISSYSRESIRVHTEYSVFI